MTLIEHHKTVNSYWSVHLGSYVLRLSDPPCGAGPSLSIKSTLIGWPGSIGIYPENWPAIRDAGDALHRVWEEQCRPDARGVDATEVAE